MALVIDKIVGPLNHTHRDLISTTGGPIEGVLEFPVAGFIMNCGSKRFYVTIDCDGAITANQIQQAGSPIGLLLTLTQVDA